MDRPRRACKRLSYAEDPIEDEMMIDESLSNATPWQSKQKLELTEVTTTKTVIEIESSVPDPTSNESGSDFESDGPAVKKYTLPTTSTGRPRRKAAPLSLRESPVKNGTLYQLLQNAGVSMKAKPGKKSEKGKKANSEDSKDPFKNFRCESGRRKSGSGAESGEGSLEESVEETGRKLRAARARRKAVLMSSSDEEGEFVGNGDESGDDDDDDEMDVSDFEDDDEVVLVSEREGDEMDEDYAEEEEEEEEEDEVVLRGQVEKILAKREVDKGALEVLVKYKGKCYRKVEWVSARLVEASRKQLLAGFLRRAAHGELLANVQNAQEYENGVHKDWLKVDRIIYRNVNSRGGYRYLTKWKGLGYNEVTWEEESDLKEEKEHIERFNKYNQSPKRQSRANFAPVDNVPEFKNGRTLRDYQIKSLQWLVSNWKNQTNCILGDEMGLGKTAQSTAFLEYQRQFCDVRGPFLVIAPLSTLGHWQREIETWTDMYTVVYHGSADDRRKIERYEFNFAASSKRAKLYKFNVLITAYEVLLRESNTLTQIDWQTVIVDEAHRLKGTKSQTRTVVNNLYTNFLLLLTGTPIQNNLGELYSLMNLLNPDKFETEEQFLLQYGGDPPTVEQVTALQDELKPVLLRRMKEDVEKLPAKDETLVRCPLTPRQHAYYKALYSKQISVLLAGANTKNLPGMRNLSMELRKVCNHPFLCDGLEDDLVLRYKEAGQKVTELDMLVESSGKMYVLNQLLPKLKSEGHKVLIFSQFKIMLDVIEDYLRLKLYNYERIDGNVSQKDRQGAIDRFSRDNENNFVFLLSTRAGGAGITLTAADTVIIFDSDWNPQNDLQAMARCHRIGQDRDVMVYRLIAWGTYEQSLFECASKKYGLEEALLGKYDKNADPQSNSKKIFELLKNGAHALNNEDGNAFVAESIDQILENRSEKRQIGSRAGSTFSEVTFSVKAGDNRDFWNSLLPEAVQQDAYKKSMANRLTPGRRRKRRCVNYSERKARGNSSDSDSEYNMLVDGSKGAASASDSDDSDVEETPGNQRGSKGKKGTGKSVDQWKVAEVKSLLETYAAFGPHKLPRIMNEAQCQFLQDKDMKDIEEVCKCLHILIVKAASIHESKLKFKYGIDAPTGQSGSPSEESVDRDSMKLFQDLDIPYTLEWAMKQRMISKTLLLKGTQFKENLDSIQKITKFLDKYAEDPEEVVRLLDCRVKVRGCCEELDVVLLKGLLKNGLYTRGFKSAVESVIADADNGKGIRKMMADAIQDAVRLKSLGGTDHTPSQLDDMRTRERNMLLNLISRRLRALVSNIVHPETASMTPTAQRKQIEEEALRRRSFDKINHAHTPSTGKKAEPKSAKKKADIEMVEIIDDSGDEDPPLAKPTPKLDLIKTPKNEGKKKLKCSILSSSDESDPDDHVDLKNHPKSFSTPMQKKPSPKSKRNSGKSPNAAKSGGKYGTLDRSKSASGGYVSKNEFLEGKNGLDYSKSGVKTGRESDGGVAGGGEEKKSSFSRKSGQKTLFSMYAKSALKKRKSGESGEVKGDKNKKAKMGSVLSGFLDKPRTSGEGSEKENPTTGKKADGGEVHGDADQMDVDNNASSKVVKVFGSPRAVNKE